MQPAVQDIVIYQGDTFELFFRLRDRVWDPVTQAYVGGSYLDLTGWTGRSQIRAKADAVSTLADFTVTFTDQLVTPGGVLLSLLPGQTAPLPVTGGVWDVELTNGAAEVRTYIAGKVTVIAEVTR